MDEQPIITASAQTYNNRAALRLAAATCACGSSAFGLVSMGLSGKAVTVRCQACGRLRQTALENT